ncbi:MULTISPECIES: 2-amino-4-hydroxy-6-hydroxymethyldihydropteridine diphosphokinase [Asticcacaulis]|uniref:2-amino-4-hydroxy-6- hydroxymethyldihydropteridine diphosphokinase n=1 Tax=Asticcacaulis TaxID=76890 RepID=UPI001AE41B36|nr:MULTISPECIES: 2-amino-4-hydroxy-6-hydroxymethyldihydropteridine diphosphokinase [Asticcacaulis]MBP2158418.1 2-amino-4-hydroxy-6-hydroxymethyldihydropteridine diphosphokinase [Asticcacaulis solisilvae]MDR6799463.1 2-amino-4-hydroxy-6-hydroxymethyldihydropteridine diphosphokinase [Asticcacaulis sp. BE141]
MAQISPRPCDDDNAAILIAYGSNLPSATAFPERQSASRAFAHVVKTLQERGLLVNRISSLWRSLAWPDTSDPPYVNAVIQVKTELSPAALLSLLHGIEYTAGRVREKRNAPRVLDLDLIAYGRTIMDEDSIMLPHPRAHERAFVMGPVAEILPGWLHPVVKETALDLWKKAEIGMDAHPMAEED